jgi:hypothetical protein
MLRVGGSNIFDNLVLHKLAKNQITYQIIKVPPFGKSGRDPNTT